ncbi:natural resistance-associated macrophage protein [Microthyrium microscopicum]|uniref:Natural resistance-associated macrophage protein n=1 Tax=Microthyrium microscopicum TaxID=703497 RepID=A0A6A6US24_9PEZI|nr:natural resistance-associated macrophage protein [Microthyrium microscopicum]
MNCPVHSDPDPDEGHNQNPPALAAELTTRRSLNTPRGTVGGSRIDLTDGSHSPREEQDQTISDDPTPPASRFRGRNSLLLQEPGRGRSEYAGMTMLQKTMSGRDPSRPRTSPNPPDAPLGRLAKVKKTLVEYAKFIGPGFMVSVAYIDPGNYATDVAAGASFRYRLLFIVLLSNIFAIFLQSLCIKLGSVTGLNLAENCKAHLPPWLNYVLYFFAEAAIIATDIAEVIGTAIALNILFKIPLPAGCAISIIDVLIILIFYSSQGMSMRALRIFELFVIFLVLGVVSCFCFELSKIQDTTVGEVFRGYLPSSALVQSKGLYQSCGILGATVMPHSLYLGSGIVQNRLRDFDEHNSGLAPLKKTDSDGDSVASAPYKPSLAAIRNCMKYSVVELAFSLFTFALFVNSAILIVAGASLSSLPAEQTDKADLFSIHDLLSKSIAPVAGTMFALALLLSGTSAGIVCTIAGQMVSEGQLTWHIKPWVRRWITRVISIVPSIIIASAVGRPGLSAALEGSQVALSIILPFVSAPLIYFTWSAKIMKVSVARTTDNAASTESHVTTGPKSDNESKEGSTALGVVDLSNVQTQELERGEVEEEVVVMKNGWVTTTIASLIWLLITFMNGALIVLLATGKS